jgi:hypothetical protein
MLEFKRSSEDFAFVGCFGAFYLVYSFNEISYTFTCHASFWQPQEWFSHGSRSCIWVREGYLESGNRNYTLVQNGAGIDEEEMMDYEVMGEDEYDDELDEAVEKQNGESEVLKIVEAEEKETIEGFGEGGETEVKEIIYRA